MMWNHPPRACSGLTPCELFTRSKVPRHDVILNARVWGCPICTLGLKSQDGDKPPKWTKKAHLGMHPGSSPVHSSTVGRHLNLESGHISPQCHVVCDEPFTTVNGELTDAVFDSDAWHNLSHLGGHTRCTDSTDVHGDIVPFHDFGRDFIGDADDGLEDDDLDHHEVTVHDPSTSSPPPLFSAVPEGEVPPDGVDKETSDRHDHSNMDMNESPQ